MAVFRVDVLVGDPQPVYEWIEEHVPKGFVVRAVGSETVKGWYMKVVFKRQNDAESFHRRWYPEAAEHTVEPFRDEVYRRQSAV